MADRPPAIIPLTDLIAQHRTIARDVERAIRRVVRRGQFILGPEVEHLERELAAYCGTREAVAVASGTDALELALRASGIGPGDEVITSAFSFVATAEAIVVVGATPVFADIDLATYTVDPAQLEAKVTSKTKALLPVHLYGHPCDMDSIMRIARRHRLVVIEDCAQALGARHRGRAVGSMGKAGCFSFYPSKTLGGYGDGGMVVTNDAALAERVRLLRVHGSRTPYRHLTIGTNSRLDELQAAILRVKRHALDQWNAARARHAHRYAQAFRRHGLDAVVLPQERAGCRHVYCLYSIRLKARGRLQRQLARQGIATQVAYPSTLPAQPALKPWVKGVQKFPQAERASGEVLSLPMYPELTARQIERIVRHIAHALA